MRNNKMNGEDVDESRNSSMIIRNKKKFVQMLIWLFGRRHTRLKSIKKQPKSSTADLMEGIKNSNSDIIRSLIYSGKVSHFYIL